VQDQCRQGEWSRGSKWEVVKEVRKRFYLKMMEGGGELPFWNTEIWSENSGSQKVFEKDTIGPLRGT